MEITGENLRSWLDRFVGERHLRSSPRRHELTGDLVGETFVRAGLEVREQPVPGPFGVGRNLIATLPGAEHPERVWVIGAHYDTVEGSPGADDNGVAVAGLLAAAAWLREHRVRDTVELVAWDLEEVQTLRAGYALGSGVMAREAARRRQRLCGVFDLEMIGCCRSESGTQRFPPGFGLLFPRLKRWTKDRDGRGDFLAVVSDPASLHLAEALESVAPSVGLPMATIPVRGLARLVPDFYRSDHRSFWNRGFPALMLTDSADFRNEHYHQATDTLDTLDFDFAAKVMRTVVRTVLRLAGQTLPDAGG